MHRTAHVGLVLMAALSLSCHDAPPTEPSAAPQFDEKDPSDSPADPPDYPLPRLAVPTGKIAFTSERSGNTDVYVMNPDGSAQTRVTYSPQDDTEPSWSHDGTRIAFSRRTIPNTDYPYGYRQPRVMNANGTGVTPPLASSGRTPEWSPVPGQFTGNLIGYVRAFHEPGSDWSTGSVWVTQYDGTLHWMVPNTESPPNDALYGLSWSPDGGRIAYFAYDQDLWVINLDGSGLQNLTNGLGGYAPSWSPDGKLIAFARGPCDECFNYNIYVSTPDGSAGNGLTSGPAHDGWPTWSPDGGMIAFNRFFDDVHPQIYVMNADGSNQHNISNSPYRDWDPDWGVVMTLPVQIVNQGDIPIDPSLSEGISFAILSMADFDAVERVDVSSLAFGRTGTEQSLIGCDERGADVNGDRLLDLVCEFDASRTGLREGDREAVLTGLGATGLVLEGRGVVEVVSGGRETR